MIMDNPGNGWRDSTIWMYSSLPSNLAIGPLSTLIPLLIIEVGGGILEVAYAITLASAITIPAVFFWGFMTDFLNRRKVFIVFSYLFTTLLIASLFVINSVLGIIVIYSLIAFIGAATAAPMNLLVMETGNRGRWAHNFSLLQMLAGLGATIGLLASWIITGFLDLQILIIALTLSSLASTLLAAKLTVEPAHSKKRISLNDGIHSFLYRLVAVPSILVRIPNPLTIGRAFRFTGLEGAKKKFIIIFYLISFIFFFGTSMFNTEYPVALRYHGLSSSGVFFVMLFAMAIQTTVFFYYDYLTKKLSRRAVPSLSLALRGVAYFIVGIVFMAFGGGLFNLGNIIFYTIASGVAYAIYYPTAYAIFFNTISGSGKGGIIGIYTGLAGTGTFAGALVSGGSVVSYGFGATFIIAALLMLLCSYMFGRLPKV